MPAKREKTSSPKRVVTQLGRATDVFQTPPIVAKIKSRLKATREQQEVVGPLIARLVALGWDLDQIAFGKKEWRVPKIPSEAAKRDAGHSYDGFPCDIAVFDSSSRFGDYRHLLFIIETKSPDEDSGIGQLETYLSNEPYARLGVWTNSPEISAAMPFVYRRSNGQLERKKRLLANLPRPGEKIALGIERVTFNSLVTPTAHSIKSLFKRLLEQVVSRDGNVTDAEARLDQLCNLLLLKLDKDKRAKLEPSATHPFRTLESEARTADEIRKEFRAFAALYPDIFIREEDKTLKFSNHTLHACVGELSPYRIIDVSVSAIAEGFQVLRAEALKQRDGQYFTPQQVIESGVRLLEISYEDLIIDPACGTGGFLVEALMSMQRKYPFQHAEISRWAQLRLFGVDKDAIGVKLTKAVMQIAGDGSAHCVRGDSIRRHLWPSEFPHLKQEQFADGRFSVVLTNPPFGIGLKVSAQDARLSGFDIARDAGEGEYEDLEIGLHFLQLAYKLLRKGGRLGIVLPETYFFSPQYSFLFGWLRPKFRPKVAANIPMEAFQGFCRAKTNFYVFEKI